MINSVMMELAYIKCIITVIVISIDNAVRLYFTGYFSHQRESFGVLNNYGINFASAFEHTKNNSLTSCAATAFTLSDSSEIAFINFDFTVKDFFCFQLKVV